MFAFLGAYAVNGFLDAFSWGLFLDLVICFLGVYFIGYLLFDHPAEGLASLTLRQRSSE